MTYYIEHFLFGVYPYIAMVSFFFVSAIRYDREQYSWKASSSQLLHNTRSFIIGSHLFHWGIILLFFGHFFGLLTPAWMYTWFFPPADKQIFAMVTGGIFGTICFVGMTILVYRRLFVRRIFVTSRPSDIFILLLLYFQLILGMITIYYSSYHLDGTSMEMLASWAQHIVTLRPATAYILNTDLIFKIHIVVGLTIFLVFPFTRLVHIFSVPIFYLWRTGYQIVRSKNARYYQ